ncbi:acyl--CoA ligase [Saccharopolyspora erythraea]|uniref:class I adenylate-forming enzyme family protein n=1 Tax=Saccharopolyspora erythraea TaxID=1836 RepID=UPI001BEF2685|nr:class I adenylate-forming enzyme family protein [Saccharopolyspora erythraea]QUH02069.1 acyl--CoA ligase [Saccharopolyspora erythraea]
MRRLVREFRQRAEESDFVTVIDDSREHTARQLLARADELAGALGGERGAGTVVVQADNSWRTVAATLAVGTGGGVVAVVNRHTTHSEFAAVIEDLQPDAVVAEPSAMREWGVPASFPAWEAHAVLDGWVCLSSGGTPDVSRWSGGALIGLTSGSTGRAKGVVQSEEALRYACGHSIDINGLRRGDAVGAIVPLSSAAAYCFGVYLSLMLAGPLVLCGKWEPTSVLARMAEANVRWTMCVPTMALQLGAAAAGSRALEGMRSITVGGGPMEAGVLARAEQSLGTRILRVFGMSECLGHTSPRPNDPEETRLGRDGTPFPGTEVRAVDETGTPVARGEVGRAQVRGPSLFLGYAREGKLDPPALTADGFFPTGDLVRVHDDGAISVMGREKDVIIRGGRNIDITEIERAVATHPRVAGVCVIPVPDAVLGERVAALVVTADGGRFELEDATRHLHEVGLSKTKWPEFVFTVDDLPQTAVGKLDRRSARDLAHELHSRLPGSG